MTFQRKLIQTILSKRFFASSCKKARPDCRKKPSKGRKRGPAECLVGVSGVYPAAEGAAKMWRNISLFICLPLIGLAFCNVFVLEHEHPERPPFIPLEYMRIRTRKFWWRGGTDESLFHNPRINALPDGYHDDED